ncbi:MAG: NusG domain II-containing protein [Oscillospiraceae bacterium]|nr:NusG domain II-containing protein [Oscillospiraceae bacterium]
MSLNKPVVAIIFVLIIAAAVVFFNRSDAKTAVIIQNRQVLYKINLEAVESEYELLIGGDRGITNTVTIRPGAIGVSHADCPDKICVKTGFIESGARPIICLPNRLEVKIINESDNNIDVVTG